MLLDPTQDERGPGLGSDRQAVAKAALVLSPISRPPHECLDIPCVDAILERGWPAERDQEKTLTLLVRCRPCQMDRTRGLHCARRDIWPA